MMNIRDIAHDAAQPNAICKLQADTKGVTSNGLNGMQRTEWSRINGGASEVPEED